MPAVTSALHEEAKNTVESESKNTQRRKPINQYGQGPKIKDNYIIVLTLHFRYAIITSLLLSFVAASPAEANKNVSEAALKALNKQIESIQGDIAKDKNRQTKLQSALRNTEKRIGQIANTLRNTKQAIRQEQSALVDLESQRKTLSKQQRQQQTLVGEQIRQAYQLGSESKLKLFLQQNDISAIGRQIRYLDYVNKARVDSIAEYAATLEELKTVEAAMKEKTVALANKQQRLTEQRDSLQRTQTERQVALKKLLSKLNTQQSTLQDLRSNQQEMQTLLNRVSRASKRLMPAPQAGQFAKHKGKLPWPIKGKHIYRYGKTRPGSDVVWQGVTIAARSGADIRAIYPGRVIFADWFRGQGLLVIVDHGNDYISLYAHNQSLLKNTGDWVDAGEPIATAGNSGGYENSALYFEIRHNGKPDDPNDWCG